MNVFIQNPGNKLFFDRDGNWTGDLGHAQSFHTFEDATEACRSMGVDDFQLLLRFQSPILDIVLSKGDVQRLAAQDYRRSYQAAR